MEAGLAYKTRALPFFFLILGLGACSFLGPEDVETDTRAEDAAAVLSRETDDGAITVSPDGAFLEANKTYGGLASRVLANNQTGGDLALRAARLNSEANRSQLFPQVQPVASIDQDGSPVARIELSQIIYSNGQFQAERDVLRAAEIEALAQLLLDSNQRVADVIGDYIDINFFRQSAGVAGELEKKYANLVNQAERRVAGGIGDDTEVATFRLKLLEAQSDRQENAANQRLATQRLNDLTQGATLPASPPAIQNVAAKSVPPELVLLYAQSAAAQGRIAQERANRRPRISLEAFTGRDIRESESEDGVSLGVGFNVPLGVRRGLPVEAAETEFLALQAEIETTERDLNREVSQLQATIQSDRAQVNTLRELAKTAENRVKNFDEQFLSGAVSLEEAVSVLETFKRAELDLVQTRSDILRAQVEIARINGQLMPTRAVP